VLVGDQDKALEFYRDVIGLEVRADMPFAGGRWVTVDSAKQPVIEFIRDPEMVPDEAVGAAARARLAGGAQGTLICTTDAVDATFARLRDAGAEVTQEPISPHTRPKRAAASPPRACARPPTAPRARLSSDTCASWWDWRRRCSTTSCRPTASAPRRSRASPR
jgi:catechol 2,3-dioxygenase-like lactoylglutathione lyase family enzyme